MTKKQKRVKRAIDYLKNYINTYENQFGYLNYSDDIIIGDILYGLGVALHGEKCEYIEGYALFKETLKEHLMK